MCSPAGVRVLRDDGSAVPFTLRGQSLEFFSGTPGTVRVLAGDREYVYSLTLPQLWESQWDVPPETRRGIPKFAAPLAGGHRPVAVAGAGGRRGTAGRVDSVRPFPPPRGRAHRAVPSPCGRRRDAMTSRTHGSFRWLSRPSRGRPGNGATPRAAPGLAVKAAALAAILLALAEPRLTFYESKVAVAILVDTSASVSRQDLDAASAAATAVERGRGRNWTQVLPFARAPRNPAPTERTAQAWKLGIQPRTDLPRH